MSSCKYISTRGGVAAVDFPASVMMGLAEDGGLLLPESIPSFAGELEALSGLTYPELAFRILTPFVGEALPAADLRDLLARSYATFDTAETVPVVPLGGGLHLAELFHGPTLAFKDIALQFLGNLFEYILQQKGGHLNILGATSGDTGSAAIHGVRGKKGINIFILYPDGRVSPLQERQMATVPDANVHCLAIRGTFDDGQSVLKEVFNDLPFKRQFSLGAVNSVNWARIVAQVVYYFWAPFQVSKKAGRPADTYYDVAVPTGNFGDIFAGYIAKKAGAPIDRLILATNENDILTRFFNTGEYRRGSVNPTISPSMDIQVASNFERYLYFRVGQDPARTKALMQEFASTKCLVLDGHDPVFAAGKANTAETLATIKRYWQDAHYLLDPHSAVGVTVASRLHQGREVICLGTAHPAKFPQAICTALGDSAEARQAAKHPALEKLLGLELRKTIVDPKRELIEDLIRQRLGGK